MGGGLGAPPAHHEAKQKQPQTRLQLSVEAIKMFYSKLRPTDSLGVVIFDNTAEVVLKQTVKAGIEEAAFFMALNELKPRGGTTISKGFELSKDLLSEYIHENTKEQCENRMIMITDVCDNSLSGSNDFVQKASETNIHLSIIGVSSGFRSETCEKLKNIKGFNYFSAVNEEDLMKYIFHTFDFGFFPVAHDIELAISAKNLKSFQVYGSTDADQVSDYNNGFAGEATEFVISRMKSVFPSEISIKDGNVLTVGGLVLLKLKTVEQRTEFEGKITLNYKVPNGKTSTQKYPFSFKAPFNEQYMSEECLYEAIEGYAFTS